MENGTFHKFSITWDAYPFQLFINAERSHLMIKYTLTSLSSKVDREYTWEDAVWAPCTKRSWYEKFLLLMKKYLPCISLCLCGLEISCHLLYNALQIFSMLHGTVITLDALLVNGKYNYCPVLYGTYYCFPNMVPDTNFYCSIYPNGY